MWERPRAHLDGDAINAAEHFVVVEDLLHSFLGIADNERPLGSAERIEVGAADRGPSALLADLSKHPLVAGKVIITRFLCRGGKGSQGMDADFE